MQIYNYKVYPDRSRPQRVGVPRARPCGCGLRVRGTAGGVPSEHPRLLSQAAHQDTGLGGRAARSVS